MFHAFEPGRLRRVARELVDEVGTDRLPGEEEKDADDEQPDPERPELETTTAYGKPDGKRCYKERQNPEPGCEGTKDAHRRLHGFELVGVDELDASCGGR